MIETHPPLKGELLDKAKGFVLHFCDDCNYFQKEDKTYNVPKTFNPARNIKKLLNLETTLPPEMQAIAVEKFMKVILDSYNIGFMEGLAVNYKKRIEQ